jgi:hypothetical protein
MPHGDKYKSELAAPCHCGQLSVWLLTSRRQTYCKHQIDRRQEERVRVIYRPPVCHLMMEVEPVSETLWFKKYRMKNNVLRNLKYVFKRTKLHTEMKLSTTGS